MKVSMVVERGPAKGREIPLKKQKTVLGKSEQCDIRIDSNVTSRRHCEISIEKDFVALRDLGSRNGTLLNGKRITEDTFLADGDMVIVGDAVFKVRITQDERASTHIPIVELADGVEAPAAEQAAPAPTPQPEPQPLEHEPAPPEIVEEKPEQPKAPEPAPPPEPEKPPEPPKPVESAQAPEPAEPAEVEPLAIEPLEIEPIDAEPPKPAPQEVRKPKAQPKPAPAKAEVAKAEPAKAPPARPIPHRPAHQERYSSPMTEEIITAESKPASSRFEGGLYEHIAEGLVHASESVSVHYERASSKVRNIMELMTRVLGIGEEERRSMKLAALVYEVGKYYLSADMLNKSEALTPAEKEQMNRHPQLALRLFANVPLPAAAKEAIKHHHERYDGAGYPDGLKGEEIPAGARMLAIADALAAITSSRPYRPAMSTPQALDELEKNAGTQFDPGIIAKFVDYCRLHSGELRDAVNLG